MRRIERRTPCIGDNQPHGRGRHAECGAQHVTQRDTRRSAALRILDAQEAQRPRMLGLAQHGKRGRRERHAPVEIDPHDLHAGAPRGGRQVERMCAIGAAGRIGSGRGWHRQSARAEKRPMLIDRLSRASRGTTGRARSTARGDTVAFARMRMTHARRRMPRMDNARRIGRQRAVLQPVQRERP